MPGQRRLRADPAQTWRRFANCRDTPPGLMYPSDGAGVLVAKAVCEGCAATKGCLAYALAAGEMHGVWGGLSERERGRIRRAQRAAAAEKAA